MNLSQYDTLKMDFSQQRHYKKFKTYQFCLLSHNAKTVALVKKMAPAALGIFQLFQNTC